ncbi:MAG: SUMF1/EgtB/PvdO family nonheme iron enzyme [Magnetococcales bacterium]|nr:SUMF1/EgtB/PvdO family nonheme iron enzyme [Magnetococcales bacterium]
MRARFGRTWIWGATWVALLSGGWAEAAVERDESLSEWREPLTDMPFVPVPAGCFEMGSAEPVLGATPIHRVCLHGFWMGRHEVTNGAYAACVADGACLPPERRDSGINEHFRTGNEDHYDQFGAALDAPDHPVVGVSRVDAMRFATWLTAHGAFHYRLPSEAEWEYACRAGQGDEPVGEPESLDGLGWFRHNSDGRPHAVGGKRANGFGLHDLRGNVWEWVLDHFDRGAYARHADHSPLFVKDDLFHVTRGGSWSSAPVYLHCAFRGVGEERDRDDNLGFRLVREE